MPVASAIIVIILIALLVIFSNSRVEFFRRVRHPIVLTVIAALLVVSTLFIADRYFWRFVPQTELLGVTLGDDIEQARENFGKPTNHDDGRYFFDRGIFVEETDGKITALGLNQHSYIAISGIRVDMPLAKLITLLGHPDSIEGQVYIYDRIHLWVRVSNDRVVEVRSVLEP